MLQVAGHEDVLEGNPTLKQRLQLRDRYITPLNVQQAYSLKKMRSSSCTRNNDNAVQEELNSGKVSSELVTLNTTTAYPPGLEDTLILTMKGIAAGMQNTG
jgi:phosphoenolpyruvate carboxylase